MKFLADMGISLSTVQRLRDEGHDVAHLRERGLSRLADDAILNLAQSENRVVLTFDLDFSSLLASGNHISPSVITFRLRDETPSSVTPRLLRLLADHQRTLIEGAIVIVEEARSRIRPLPILPST
jgi:predicted nuclease of predicted toxin-antitoxin system